MSEPDWADEIAKNGCGGYAPGDYMNKCCRCGCVFQGDKRAVTCSACAVAAALRKARADALEQAAEWFDRKATPISPDVVSYRIRALKDKP
jgi:hypothetical protein